MPHGVRSEALRLVQERLSVLPAGLRAHVERARRVGAELADLFEVNAERVDLALAAHDLYRAADNATLLAEARHRGCTPDQVEAAEPMLLHGEIAALWLAREAGVSDPEVLEAVRRHTTFAPGLGALEAAVFLADKLDPDKVRRRPWLARIDALARSGDWRTAVAAYLRRLDDELTATGIRPHPLAAEALAWLDAADQG